MSSALLKIVCLLSILRGIRAHGRLTTPVPRQCEDGECRIDDWDSPININGDGEAESERAPVNDPASHYEGQSLVCRVPNGMYEAAGLTPVTAGSTLDLRWDLTADHPGNGGLYISYDAEAADTQAMEFFKIANFPQLRQQNEQTVTVNIPAWLPPGRALLRWDWYATHNYPWIEFYANCIDINIVSDSTVDPSAIPKYPITYPGTYPVYNDEDAYYCGDCRWDQAEWLSKGVKGPSCVPGVTGNCCDLTSYVPTESVGGGFPLCANVGTSGDISEWGSNPTPTPATPTPTPAAPTPTPAAPTPTPAAPTPTPGAECEVPDFPTCLTDACEEQIAAVDVTLSCESMEAAGTCVGEVEDLGNCDIPAEIDNYVDCLYLDLDNCDEESSATFVAPMMLGLIVLTW